MVHAIKVIFSVVAGWAVVLVLAVVLAFTRWREHRRELRTYAKDARATEATVAAESNSQPQLDADLPKSEASGGLVAR